ncbi:MAG: hypothetical protein K2I83_03920 [Bacteroidales bacterium]|nr:hypothetical protein [Bacteroidales bacterium]
MESVFKFWKNVERKAQELIPLQVFPAQVKEVDENNRTCTVRVNDNVDLYDVKLYAVTDKDLKGFCLLPAKDSQVLVARIANGNDLYVCMFSVVDKVVGTIGDKVKIAIDEKQLYYKNNGTEVKVGSTEEQATVAITTDKVTIDANSEIVFNGGNNQGLVKIKELTDKINTLVKAFNGHTHTISGTADSVGKFTGSTQTSETQAEELQQSAYEDTKIKH